MKQRNTECYKRYIHDTVQTINVISAKHTGKNRTIRCFKTCYTISKSHGLLK